MERLKIIVSGFIGLYPTGGVTWDYIQYLLGLRALGHDVFYIEDTAQFPKYQKSGRRWDDPTDSIAYLQQTMERFGFSGRWAYRDVGSDDTFGLSEEKVREICREADVFINVSASAYMREEYQAIPKRVFIDSDPMFTQIEYYHQTQNNTDRNPYRMNVLVEHHNYFFSFGENIGMEGCRIPLCGFDWRTTRQPICLDYWRGLNGSGRDNVFTTVMNWSVSSNLIYDQMKWGQKNVEFDRFLHMPVRVPGADFEIMASNIPHEKAAEIRSAGWKIQDPLTQVTNSETYRNYIVQSSAEFSVAKETYVKSRSGWFSCRSACYLAAGKPVITQDTGWSAFIPSGSGLFAFSDMDSAIEAIREVQSNLKAHSNAASEIAREYFDSRKVLQAMLDQLAS